MPVEIIDASGKLLQTTRWRLPPKVFRPTAIEFFPASRMNEARIWLSP